MTRIRFSSASSPAGPGVIRDAAVREDGYVMVVMMLLLLIALGIGAAGLTASLASRSHSNLDARARRALQAADAGVQAVMYRENQLDLGSLNLTGGSSVTSSLLDCLVPNLSSGLPASNLISRSITSGGACPVGQWHGAGGTAADDVPFSTTVPIGNHDSYNAEFIPNATTLNATSGVGFAGAKVVSIGVDDNGHAGDPNRYVYQRVEATVTSLIQSSNSTPTSPLPWMMLEANHDLTLQVPAVTAFNGTARVGHQLFFDLQNSLVSAFTGTNILSPGGAIIEPTSLDVGCPGNTGPSNAYTLQNRNPLLSVFAAAVLGGYHVANPQTCSTPYFFNRPALSISSSKPDCPSSCGSLTGYSGGDQDEIFITNGAQLNLAPGDYVFCSFQTNGPVNITASNSTNPVRIFIDYRGSRCGDFASHSSVGLPSGFQTGAGSFVAKQGIGGLIGGLVTTLFPSQVQVYVAGNGTPDGTVATSGPASVANGYFMYAPMSKVFAGSLVALRGAMIGYDLTVNTILYDESPTLWNISASGSTSNGGSPSSSGIFRTQQYVQCTNSLTALTGTTATDTAGC